MAWNLFWIDDEAKWPSGVELGHWMSLVYFEDDDNDEHMRKVPFWRWLWDANITILKAQALTREK